MNYIFGYISIVLSALVLFSCNSATPTKNLNEVLVLGAIHSGHLTDSVYHTAYLEKLFTEIAPDYVLAEIPPDRMQAAMDGFMRDDTISEPRVMRFPEYTDVIFPLTKTMDFEIIPTAGWTENLTLYIKQLIESMIHTLFILINTTRFKMYSYKNIIDYSMLS